jgi:hypothetical protein
MIRIVVGGDVCPTGKVQASFSGGRAQEIFHDLLPEIESADLAIVNLECPLVSRSTPTPKAGPVLGAAPECIRGFVDAQWDVLNLANNHSYDHGATGLLETLQTIQNTGLTAVGAGANLAAAQQPVIRQVNGQRVVIYSMAEREFSLADATTPGANPLDLIDFVQAVRHHKKDGVFIALFHGGREYYPYPTPEMVRRCRFMVEMGADAVICCHTHCPLPWEIHAGRPIIYGLGNLVFEPLRASSPSWHQGYMARLEIDENGVRFEPIPYTQSLGAIGARSMALAEGAAFRKELERRGEELKDLDLMAAKWKDFCQQEKNDYLSELFGYPKPMLRFRRQLVPLIHSRRAVLQSLLLVQCETHREVLENILQAERTRE